MSYPHRKLVAQQLKLSQKNTAMIGANTDGNRHLTVNNNRVYRSISDGICHHADPHCCCHVMWHIPPSCFMQYARSQSAESMASIPMYDPDTEIYFAVVRNPYIRLLSQYWYRIYKCHKNAPLSYLNYSYGHAERKHYAEWKGWCDRRQLNAWIRRMFGNDIDIRMLTAQTDCHMIPQWRYTEYLGNDHILHMENLQTEFNALMKLYSVGIELTGNIENLNQKEYCDEGSIMEHWRE